MNELKVADVYSPSKAEYAEMPTGSMENMLETRAVANFLSRSKFLPQALRGDLNTAVMLCVTCKQMGLPITALSEVMEVNGKISFWGRTKLAIVMKSPLCEYIMAEEQDDTKCTLVAKRKGWPKEVKETYTIQMAEKAGLINRSDAWKKHPADMLYWRAVTRVISKVFPDVIQGFASVEDLEDGMDEKVSVVAKPVPAVEEKPALLVDERPAKRARAPKKVEPTEVIEPAPEFEAHNAPETAPIEQEVVPADVVAAPGTEEVQEPQVEEQPMPEAQHAGAKTYNRYRTVKQVAVANGVKYILGINPLNGTEDKFAILSATTASELKKATGTQVCLVVNELEEVVDFHNAAD